MSGGLYISAVADDFFTGWFNGAFALTAETTVATENYFHISLKTDNGDALRTGLIEFGLARTF